MQELPDKAYMEAFKYGGLPEKHWFTKRKKCYQTVTFSSGRYFRKTFKQVEEYLKYKVC